MQGRPVTIRLLDPPLHEFLPLEEEVRRQIETLQNAQPALENVSNLPSALRTINPNIGESLNNTEAALKELIKVQAAELEKKKNLLRTILNLKEFNPMLGHRGVRLGITYPEIYEMQIQALLEAASELVKENVPVNVELMVPNVCTCEELKRVQAMIQRIKKQTEDRYGVTVPFKFGTMVEVVRACMRAGKLAEIAEFFSFGTNDLTQATFSFSREDVENKFLPLYNQQKILNDNPFEVLDTNGVGRLMSIAVEDGRKVRPELKVGICGEQGGEPSSVEFCHSINLNYVSCSPYRIPIARLAAAQAAIKEKNGTLKPPVYT
jgi:pyruvate,orthophosphate dikinase